MIRIRYFARLREQLATSEERLEWDADVHGVTIADLRQSLTARGGVWAEALGAQETVLAAVDQELARPETPIQDGQEVAFFPPVTGG
ncbi:molybdopterin converting factor subunit 1 [Allochromatium palmeri]|uniref:Molybdopterin synthase sulfur carrier subunit n=1 Tax=Allochromatium palmeri TaxID=231048 RepID=A0A6N8EB68_9GAMM|nr:molybdopterin converting factor subunit 1 [Allochromatium palmeri]MTW20588.1 molybdopterin converting factor subunit 1 [Allochromatium palmeri]